MVSSTNDDTGSISVAAGWLHGLGVWAVGDVETMQRGSDRETEMPKYRLARFGAGGLAPDLRTQGGLRFRSGMGLGRKTTAGVGKAFWILEGPSRARVASSGHRANQPSLQRCVPPRGSSSHRVDIPCSVGCIVLAIARRRCVDPNAPQHIGRRANHLDWVRWLCTKEVGHEMRI